MPTTMSASRICSRRAFSSFGKSSSTAESRTLRQTMQRLRLQTHYGGYGLVIDVHRLAEVVEEPRGGSAYAHPVRDRGRPQRIGKELVGRHSEGLRERLHCGFFLMTIEQEPVNHGVGVITADAILGHA